MSFARYPSLIDKVVFITGGGSGIGAAMVEAFAEQKANVAFVDIAVEPSKELVAKIGASHPPPLFLPLRPHRHRRARNGDGGGSAAHGADRRARQQRRQRPAPGGGRSERRGLGSHDGAQSQAPVLRRPDRAPLDARAWRRGDRQFLLDRLDAWGAPIVGLLRRQGRGRRPDEQSRARVRPRQYPRQRHRAWRGNHRAAAPPCG